MKRIAIILLALVAFAMQGWSQNVTQNVRVPAWEKFVRVNRDGANLRKAPNTQSQKLYIQELMGSETGHAYSWTAMLNYNPYHPDQNKIFPVIREDNGWYLIHVDYETDAYIRKDLCMQVEPIKSQRLSANNKVQGSGGYYAKWTQHAGGAYCRFGNQFGRAILWNDYDMDEAITFVYSECGVRKEMSGPFYTNLYELSANRIKETNLKEFMANHGSSATFAELEYAFYDANGNESYYRIFYNPQAYSYRTVTEPETYQISKFIVPATGKEMMVYQRPSTTSPKLVFVIDPDDEGGGDGPGGFWSWDKQSYRRQYVSVVKPELLPVIGEEGNYYKVLAEVGSAYYSSSEYYIGYVPKQNASEVRPITATRDLLDSDHLSPSGNYLLEWGVMDFLYGSFIKISKIDNGVIKSTEWIGYMPDRDAKVVTIGNNDNNRCTLRGSQYFKMQDGYLTVDLSRLSDADILRILKTVNNQFKETRLILEGGRNYYHNGGILNGRDIVLNVTP